MELLEQLISRVTAVRDGLANGTLVRDVLVNHQDDILTLQKEQLFNGKRSDGEDMRPFYSEDLKPTGHFYTVEAAKRYSDWKLSIPYPSAAQRANRNPDAPNLYINGKFHSELGVRFDTDSVSVTPTTPSATEIMARYGIESFGLTTENWNMIWQEGALDELMNIIKEIL